MIKSLSTCGMNRSKHSLGDEKYLKKTQKLMLKSFVFFSLRLRSCLNKTWCRKKKNVGTFQGACFVSKTKAQKSEKKNTAKLLQKWYLSCCCLLQNGFFCFSSHQKFSCNCFSLNFETHIKKLQICKVGNEKDLNFYQPGVCSKVPANTLKILF